MFYTKRDDRKVKTWCLQVFFLIAHPTQNRQRVLSRVFLRTSYAREAATDSSPRTLLALCSAHGAFLQTQTKRPLLLEAVKRFCATQQAGKNV